MTAPAEARSVCVTSAPAGDVITTTPSRHAADAARSTLSCPVCELSGGPFEADEAAHLIGLHNHLHHGGLGAAVDPVDPVGGEPLPGDEEQP